MGTNLRKHISLCWVLCKRAGAMAVPHAVRQERLMMVVKTNFFALNFLC